MVTFVHCKSEAMRCRLFQQWISRFVGLAVLGIAGCGEASNVDKQVASRLSLWDHSKWVDASPTHPFVDLEPIKIDCPRSSSVVEDLAGEPSIQIDTGECNFWVQQQDLTVELQQGDVVQIRLWHFPLVASEPAIGYASLALGDDIIFSVEEPIVRIGEPAQSRLIGDDSDDWIVVGSDYPVGTPITIHVRNHGDNQWNWISFEQLYLQ